MTEAKNLGDHANYGVIAGSVDASLALADRSQQITLRGTWGCVIDPVANGA